MNLMREARDSHSSGSQQLVYKYLSPERIDFFEEGHLRMAQPSALNDAFECLSFLPVFEDTDAVKTRALVWECYRTALEHLNAKIGILSFSKRWAVSAMWAHYADQHRGLCVGFDRSDPFFKAMSDKKEYGCLYDVEYVLEKMLWRVQGKEDPDISIFFIKSLDWVYEQEVRAICDLSKHDKVKEGDNKLPIYLTKIPFRAVKEIIVGCYSNATVQCLATHAARNLKVPIYRTHVSMDASFDMGRESFEGYF